MGCDPPPSSSQRNITKAEARKFLKEGDKSVKAFRGGEQIDAKRAAAARHVGPAASDNTFYLNFKGTVALTPPRGVRGFGAFSKGSLRGGGTVRYVSSSDALRGDAKVLLKFSSPGAGAVCVRVTGRTDLTQQFVKGKFQVLGGTGRAARLHDRGALRAVQPKAFVTDKYRAALFGTPSLGARRSVPRGCGRPIKAPHQAKFTSTFDGFAFAPASARNGRLPAGTKLYTESSVTGNAGCGGDNNLYLVTTYSGPKGAVLNGSAFYSSSPRQANLHQALTAGQNAVFLFAKPANGTYQLKADVTAPRGVTGSATFGQEITLQRSC